MRQRPTVLSALLIQRKSRGVAGGWARCGFPRKAVCEFIGTVQQSKFEAVQEYGAEMKSLHTIDAYMERKSARGDLVTSETLLSKGKPVLGDKQ
jgi:hypothetical protein